MKDEKAIKIEERVGGWMYSIQFIVFAGREVGKVQVSVGVQY